jgi:hypothetical protein
MLCTAIAFGATAEATPFLDALRALPDLLDARDIVVPVEVSVSSSINSRMDRDQPRVHPPGGLIEPHDSLIHQTPQALARITGPPDLHRAQADPELGVRYRVC